jgi:hypothetical protein
LMDIQIEPNPVFGRTARTQSTALHFAVMGLGEPNKDTKEVINLLLEAKADLFAQKVDKDTPLCLLAKTADDVDIANQLIQKMMEMDFKQTVPIDMYLTWTCILSFSMFRLWRRLHFFGRSLAYAHRSCSLRKEVTRKSFSLSLT